MMKQISTIFLAITFIGLLTIGCENNLKTEYSVINKETLANFELLAVKKIIEEKNNQFTKAHITGDTAFLNNIFTTDARILPPNSTVVTGRAAISELNSQYVNFGIKEFREENISFYGNKDFLIDEGTYFMKYGNDNTTETGKYINIWKKENGEWKIFTNMWNSNVPANNAQ